MLNSVRPASSMAFLQASRAMLNSVRPRPLEYSVSPMPTMAVLFLMLMDQFDVHPNQITQWKTQLLDRAAQLFGAGTGQAEKPVDMKVLHAKIGELALENDFLESALTKAGLPGTRR